VSLRPGTRAPGRDGRPDAGRPRAAFYALAPGGWRDYLTLLHPPYTAWHLSYVVLGASLAPELRWDRLAATLLAFFCALGIGAHALDELAGRPLRTRISSPVLAGLGAGGVGVAVALGIAGSLVAGPWLLAFVAFGAFIAPAYNLEWFSGRFHSDFWFAAAWGAFPLVTACFASAGALPWAALPGAGFAFATSLAQRTLSTRARTVRRRARSVEGSILYIDGTVEDIDRRSLIRFEERALLLLTIAMPAVAIAALASR
jgi:hypothetical protein